MTCIQMYKVNIISTKSILKTKLVNILMHFFIKKLRIENLRLIPCV